MHYFLFPEKDSTIYQSSVHQNSGIDQILELEKLLIHAKGDVAWNSRILIKFDLDSFSASFSSGELSGSNMKYFLNLYTDEAVEIPLEYDVFVYPISQSWEMGVGKRGDNPISKTGVSWNVRDGVTLAGVTGSEWALTGSDFISGSGYESSQSFNFQTTDLHVDVTTMVEAWLSGTIENYGFLIKRGTTDEQSILNQGNLQFFSNETHTIFRPRLEIVWEDFAFNPYEVTTTSESFTVETSSLSVEDNPTVFVITNDFFSGSTIFPTSSYVTKSGDITTWFSESYYFETASIWSYTSSLSLYHSSSAIVANIVTSSYIYTSGSNSFTSTSVELTSHTVTDFYTGSLGGEYRPGTLTHVSYSLSAGLTGSSIWTLNQTAGYYFSQSLTAVTASYTYDSSSITGFATASSSTTTQLMFPIGADDFVIYITNLKNEYKQDAKIRFRVNGRERYPQKTFVTESWSYTRDIKFLPTKSYYGIKDSWNEVEMIPFSTYTQLSVDATGSFFDIYLNGFEPERIYRVLFKVIQGNIETIYDKDNSFRIIR